MMAEPFRDPPWLQLGITREEWNDEQELLRLVTERARIDYAESNWREHAPASEEGGES